MNKKIKTQAEAWRWLGEQLERFEYENAPVKSQFPDGLCMVLSRCIHQVQWWGFQKVVQDTIQSSTLRAMETDMKRSIKYQHPEKNDWSLGEWGGDYGVRALWCYLMAEKHTRNIKPRYIMGPNIWGPDADGCLGIH